MDAADPAGESAALEGLLPADVLRERRTAQVLFLPKASSREAAEEALMRCYDPRRRRAVRQARRRGVVVRPAASDADWEALTRFHRENIEAISGIAKPPEFFRLARERLVPAGLAEMTVAELDGDVVAALLVGRAGGAVEYLSPARDGARRDAQQAPSLLLHEAILEACLRGDRAFNFQGTWISQTEVRRFKKSFGAVDVPYTYFCRARVGEAEALPLRRACRWFYIRPFAPDAAACGL